MRKKVAIILAGGTGSRMGFDLPKQFIKVAGKRVLEHTVQTFQDHEEIDEVAIVTHPYYVYLVEECMLGNVWPKVRKILFGGKERYHSSLSAIRAYEEEEEDVDLIFHDAVRPLINKKVISEVIRGLSTYSAVDTAIPTADTIIKVNAKTNLITSIPDRTMLMRGQTPQGFRLRTIKEAYENALKDPDFKATDDCGVVVKYLPDIDVLIVNGEETNIKLTYREDVYLLDKLFQLKTTNITVSPSLDKAKNKIIVVFGGSKGIGAEIVRICNENGGRAYPFSRSFNNIDIANPANIKKALDEVFLREGRIDGIINTAALLSREPLVSMQYERMYQILNVNLKGVINVAVEAFPYLKMTEGHLLFYTSSSYTRGRSLYSLYSATKAAVVNFVQAISDEWSPFNIHVNCVNPERTKTSMRTRNFGVEPDETLLTPEKVAIASLEVLNSSLTGQVFDVKLETAKLNIK